MVIYTIGHSTRRQNELVEILNFYQVSQLIDIRSIPRSRHTPQFNKDKMAIDLPKQGINYQHLPILGGRRHTTKSSINAAWRNASFRGYADYMQTVDFQLGINQLIELAVNQTTAIMCAEAVPWRCHRSMVGDALLIRGISVVDIYDKKRAQLEKLTSFARVDGTKIIYPSELET